jgi:hypothetical protein
MSLRPLAPPSPALRDLWRLAGYVPNAPEQRRCDVCERWFLAGGAHVRCPACRVPSQPLWQQATRPEVN